MTDSMSTPWLRTPGNAAARRWLTRPDCRTVLVVVPHMTAGTRLADVLPLLEADHRVQVLFTVPTTADMWPGVEDYVRSWDGVLVPWNQALRTRFDLALAASYQEIDKIDAPVLVLPHGVAERSRISPRDSGQAEDTSSRMRDLVVRDGRVVPAGVVFAREEDARRFRADCPEAASRALVAGDLCLDRIRASLPYRDQYRRALGVNDDRRIVLVSSTWSRWSLFGTEEGLLTELVRQLPADEYRVVAALHPLIWAAHGAWQIRAWLAAALDEGLVLLRPEEGWRAGLVAADHLVGDHGSVTLYGAALGLPALLHPAAGQDVRPDSPAGHLWRVARTIDPDRPFPAQLRASGSASPSHGTALAQRISSAHGRAGVRLRREMYRLLGLSEPARGVPLSPVPLPVPATGEAHRRVEP
ncbi:hypothetical protein [Saccharomonospora iraqiensis]|uniref:hypothetical protein n=1 Tax=Saccharomonospora iraqiensis TaxID=52698 RepID=UPI0002F2C5E4|nr:hypothetical protein [Saccharomonospora iraqiensis]